MTVSPWLAANTAVVKIQGARDGHTRGGGRYTSGPLRGSSHVLPLFTLPAQRLFVHRKLVFGGRYRAIEGSVVALLPGDQRRNERDDIVDRELARHCLEFSIAPTMALTSTP